MIRSGICKGLNAHIPRGDHGKVNSVVAIYCVIVGNTYSSGLAVKDSSCIHISSEESVQQSIVFVNSIINSTSGSSCLATILPDLLLKLSENRLK
jgi:hypothetical protein